MLLVLLYKKHLDNIIKKNVINNDNDSEIFPCANFINGFA